MPLTDTAAQFRAAALELRAADRQMFLLARRNIRAATGPAADAVRQSALSTLPHTGGLNQWVADATIKTSILTGPRTAGVRLTATRTGHDLVAINGGVAKHPVYANRNVWATTRVTPGFWDKPLRGLQAAVAASCVAVVDETALIAGFH